jgi:hypothetical protein
MDEAELIDEQDFTRRIKDSNFLRQGTRLCWDALARHPKDFSATHLGLSDLRRDCYNLQYAGEQREVKILSPYQHAQKGICRPWRIDNLCQSPSKEEREASIASILGRRLVKPKTATDLIREML